MNRHFIKITLFICLSIFGTNTYAAANYQDWWWNPAYNGMGFNIGQKNSTLTVAWYLYDNRGQPSFLLLSGKLAGNRLDGVLTRSTGPAPGPGFNPDTVARTTVGTASLVFKSEHEAAFYYDYEGNTGTIELERFTYSSLPVTGKWIGFLFKTVSGCTNKKQNGSFIESAELRIFHDHSPSYSITLDSENDSCKINASLSQHGSTMSGSGTLNCSYSAMRGTIQINRVDLIEENEIMAMEYSYSVTSGGKCTAKGHFLVVR